MLISLHSCIMLIRSTMFVIIPISHRECKTCAFCTMQNFIQNIKLSEIMTDTVLQDHQDNNVQNVHYHKANTVGVCWHSCVHWDWRWIISQEVIFWVDWIWKKVRLLIYSVTDTSWYDLKSIFNCSVQSMKAQERALMMSHSRVCK